MSSPNLSIILTSLWDHRSPGPRIQQFLEDDGPEKTAFRNVPLQKRKLWRCLLGSERSLWMTVILCLSLLETWKWESWKQSPHSLTTPAGQITSMYSLLLAWRSWSCSDHFSHILEECQDFKSSTHATRERLELKVDVRQVRHLQPQVLWQRLLQATVGRPDQFSHIRVTVKIMLVLPMSSYSCERGISAMKCIKSDWRSSLSTSMMNSLLLISVHGPDTEHYMAERAGSKWWNSKRSRLINCQFYQIWQPLYFDHSALWICTFECTLTCDLLIYPWVACACPITRAFPCLLLCLYKNCIPVFSTKYLYTILVCVQKK